jgi:hypothetical protein
MLRTYPAFIPCSATSQNWLPIRPSPTGVRRGFPVFRPFVSSNAYPGSGRPIATASLIGGFRKYFWSVWTIRCFILCRRASRWSYQMSVLYRWSRDRHRFDPAQSRGRRRSLSGGTMRQVAEFIAVLSCSLFTGAAVYITFIEHPARMQCGVELAATEPSRKRM